VCHSALRSFGTSPNFRITVASPELAGRGIPAAAERDRAHVTWLARERLGAQRGGVGAQALHRFASGDAVVRQDEGKRDVVGDVHRSLLAIARSIEPAACVAGRDGRPKLGELTLEKIVRDQQRLHRLFRVAAAGRYCLVCSKVQVDGNGCSGFGASGHAICSLFVPTESRPG
jgi:hypothetical protein